MKKILFVFGTRPEAIKLVPLIKALKSESQFETKILITHQHKEMLDQVLDLFGIKADFDLNVMKPGQDLSDITSNVLAGCRDVFKNYRPDLVLVHGDTTTTFAGSLAAFYHRIDVGHVEAGLRTFNMYSPYPEELNRQFTTKLSRFHFAPTKKSAENLESDGVKKENIIITGNTVIDTLFMAREMLETSGKAEDTSDRKSVLITGHRRENFGQGFENICSAISDLSSKYPEIDFIYPVHLNPNVQEPVKRILGNKPNIMLIAPQDYLPFVKLMKSAYLILTDSGGVQEEAPSLGVPVLVMRDTTERPEAVEAGTVKLVGSSKENIVKEVSRLIDSQEEYERMKKSINPYGDGKASQRIVEFLKINL